MASGQLGAVVRQFHRLFGAGSVSGLSEAQLLSRFVDSRDEAAFEAMVSRFGPMVLGVCRKLIDDPHLADDAFQAAFLVLARRAGSIRDRELLGNWLYGVALRVARKARADLARRRSREKGGADVTPEPIGERPSGMEPDLGPILHEELARLPSKYRDPVVLCLLDGRTHEEAAGLLRWPVGTVKGRLSRAKDLLRDRLGRRGVTATVAAVAASLARTSEASVPPLLFNQTIRAAMGIAAGGAVAAGLASAQAVALSDGVVTTMILSKTKVLALGAAMLGTLATGVGVMARQGVRPDSGVEPSPNAASSTSPGPQNRLVPELRDFPNNLPALGVLPPVKEMAARRVAMAEKNLDAQAAFYENGTITIDRYLDAARKLLEARYATVDSDQDRIKALEVFVRLSRAIVEREKAKYEVGNGALPNVAEAEADLADAEYELAKLREGAADPSQRKSAAAGASPNPATPGAARTRASLELTGPMVAARLQPGSGMVEDEDDLMRNEEIRKELNKNISMPFAQETAFEDVVKYVKTATTSPIFPQGMPIYVEPDGLQQAEKTMASPITFNQEGVKLKTSLRLILKQLGLGYYIREGLLIVTSLDDVEYRRAIGLLPRPGAGPGGMVGPPGGVGGAGAPKGGGGFSSGEGGFKSGGGGGFSGGGGGFGGPAVNGGVPPEPAAEAKAKPAVTPEPAKKP